MSTPTTTKLTREQITLCRQLAQAKVQADNAVARLEELKTRARLELPMGKLNPPLDRVTILITRNRVWNKTKAKESYGDDICTMQVDLDKARQVMSGDEFDRYYQDRAPRVEVQIS